MKKALIGTATILAVVIVALVMLLILIGALILAYARFDAFGVIALLVVVI